MEMDMDMEMVFIAAVCLVLTVGLAVAAVLALRTRRNDRLFTPPGTAQPAAPPPALSPTEAPLGDEPPGEQTLAMAEMFDSPALRHAPEARAMLRQMLGDLSQMADAPALANFSPEDGSGTRIVITDAGRNMMAVIAVLREVTALGLADIQTRLSQLPATFELDDAVDVRALSKKLSSAGVQGLQIQARSARTTSRSSSGDGNDGGQTLYLLDAGRNKIEIIKLIREATGLGLKEAKDIVDRTPCRVEASLPETRMLWLEQALRAAGAVTERRL